MKTTMTPSTIRTTFISAVLLFITLAITEMPKSLFADNGTFAMFLNEDFVYGFEHPLFSIDHLIAMASVGVLSAQLGKRSIWQVPAAFVVMMGTAGTLAILEIGLPAVETMIAFSVVAMGAAVIVGERLYPSLTLPIVACFGLFHGHAHGAEIPHLADPVLYVIGFLVATTIAHTLGVSIGNQLIKGPRRTMALRIAGGVVALVGVLLLVDLFIMP